MTTPPVFSPFAMAQEQFDRAAGLLELDEPTRHLLREPMREYRFSVPVRMDDGRARIFKGFRVHHNDARGPAKGGVRFHPAGNLEMTRALAMWGTWKCAVVDIPLGGSSGGVTCDPHSLSEREQVRLCRGWVRTLARDLGARIDVPEPDLMTNPQHMLWMLDEYETIAQAREPGMITGKPVGLGGSLGRREATGYGAVIAVREALKELGVRPDAARASVQGFGTAGRHAVELFSRLGGTVTCVACWDHKEQRAFAFRKEAGVTVEELAPLTDAFGEIDRDRAEAAGYEVLPGEAWLAQPVDVLVPAALDRQIDGGNVKEIPQAVKVVAEVANGATTAEAEEALSRRNVLVIPDLLGGAGGVTCSYFEQVQSQMNYYWQRDEVLAKLDVKLTAAYVAVSDLARKKGLSLRDAAYVIGVSRVASACRGRGWV